MEKVVAILESLKFDIFFPIHPRTMKNFKRFGMLRRLKAIRSLHLSEPVSYLDNLTLIANARAVMTDSGGMQKEAAFLKTPCLTLREETEWVETLGKGNQLVGLSLPKIKKAMNSNLRSKKGLFFSTRQKKPSEIMISEITKFLK